MNKNIALKFYYSSKIRFCYIFIFGFAFLISCNQGIAPPPAKIRTYLFGTIKYIGGKSSWPVADSVKDIRVVAFRNYPPTDILSEVLASRALYSANSLPFFVDSCKYQIEIPNPPDTLKYIVVAQNYGSLLEWRVIGVFTRSGDVSKPSEIYIKPQISDTANMKVDFNNLPPQPF
ncbi:MAG: hypothetical protein NT007_15155 [Candidatus Kapabacteria bacterium]|nr:hypothetical protein [Candidatus Kapabacteria bacterium]